MSRIPDFYMDVPLGDGSDARTMGRIAYGQHPELLGIEDADLTGMRVLDIAGQDGFWGFWAEDRGAREVVSLDVDSILQMDWSYGGADRIARLQYRSNTLGWTDTESGYGWLHRHRESSVDRISMSVYEIDPQRLGLFDLVFMYGLLYHLRHPLYALDRIRAVTVGSLILESHVIITDSAIPYSVFYLDDVCNEDYTNWVGATPSQLEAWMFSAGFPCLRSKTLTRSDTAIGRQLVVGSVDDERFQFFDRSSVPTVGEESFTMARNHIDRVLRGQTGMDMGL